MIPTRYQFVAGTFALSILLYVDRACISVAKDPISDSLGFTDKEMGWVLSAFALGYSLAQTPSGWLADRFGPRKILSSVVVFWSLFTALTSLAWNFFSMLAARFLFGVGEAGAFPGIARATFSWIPLKERGLVTGINFSGSRLGAAFGLPLVAWLIELVGWKSSFWILGGVGFLWAFLWYLWFRDRPEDHGRISKQELRYILETRQEQSDQDEKSVAVSDIFGSRQMWLAMMQYFCSNFTFFFCLTWLFPHLKNQYQLETIEAGIYASAPLICGALGNYFSGWLIDRLFKRGHWQLSRRIPAIIGFSLAAIGLVGSLQMDTAAMAVLFLSIAIFGADMTLSPSWSFCVDIGGPYAGTVSGTMNMAGNVGSFVTALAFPYLKDWTGSVTPFFVLGACLNILAVLVWTRMDPRASLVRE